MGERRAPRLTPASLLPWVVRALWIVLPFAAGPTFDAALSARSRAVQLVASAALWAGWAVVATASLVRHPLSLTLLRCAAPGALAATLIAIVAGGATATERAVAAVVTLAATVVAFLPEVALPFVNGPAYANELRLPLRAPGPLLLGPIVLAWAAVVGLPAAALLLLAARQWIAGGLALVAAVAAVYVVGRSLHALARRWVVFVPAGVVLHDPMHLTDPILMRRREIRSLTAAPADTDALDLTGGAFGLALEVTIDEEAPLALQRPGRRGPEIVRASKLLFTPTRPGAVLSEARARRID
jgi:hypothetical protein